MHTSILVNKKTILNICSVLGSPNHHHLISHPTVIGGGGKPGSKAKKRPKSGAGSPNSPDTDSMQQTQPVRRKPSVKKNKKPATLEDGAIGLEPPGSIYSNSGLPQPPAYEDSIKNAVSMQSLHNITMEPAYQYQPLPGFQEPSPPHSVTLSPSPVKSRPSLPTSPTHMAAMRAATHQKHGQAIQFDFSELSYNPTMPYQAQQYYHYLTPPSESLQAPESFPTPSPESPYYWSSSSPHSNSDWSEGISSPNNNKQTADPIYI